MNERAQRETLDGEARTAHPYFYTSGRTKPLEVGDTALGIVVGHKTDNKEKLTEEVEFCVRGVTRPGVTLPARAPRPGTKTSTEGGEKGSYRFVHTCEPSLTSPNSL